MGFRSGISFGVAVAGLFVAIVAFAIASGAFTTHAWFASQGAAEVWWKLRLFQWSLFGAGVLAALSLYGLNFAIASLRLRRHFPHQGLTPGQGRLLLGVGALLSVIWHGPSLVIFWEKFVLFQHGVSMGTADPILQRDASFYMFALPFWTDLVAWLRTLVFFQLLYALLLHVFLLSDWTRQTDSRQRAALLYLPISQAGLWGGLFLLSIAAGAYLARFTVLFEGGSDRLAGAAYTDVQARMGAYGVFAVLGGCLALATALAAFARRWIVPVSVAGVFVLLYVVLLGIYPWAVQGITVRPNELNAEKPYIEHNIRFTRLGYRLENVNKRSFDPEGTLRADVLARNPTIVQNIRLWDYRPIKATYRQLQEIKPYYEFFDVDIDRYRVNGELRQVLISARDLNHRALAGRVQSWIQTQLQYTHGYGVVMSPTNRVTGAGLPELWVKDFPPHVGPGLPELKRPGIYFGELTDQYAVVRTTMEEIDYPRDQDFAPTRYDGSGGVPLGSGLRKLLLAWQFDTWKLLVSREVTHESRLLYNRNIHRAVRLLAPFLRFDHDPYIVMARDGRLYWILDAYTVSSSFPYSRRFDAEVFGRVSGSGKNNDFKQLAGINYIRNSVKVVIDAYDGQVRFFRFDEQDPVLRSWTAFFPGLFRPLSEMPEFLLPHLRYPEMLFLVQAGIYSDYHMDNAHSFYNREDRWHVATEQYAGRTRRVEPYYTVIRLPGEKQAEYILMLPFVPAGKQNLIAWMAARCDFASPVSQSGRRPGGPPRVGGPDAGAYGEILVLDFPRSRQIYGPIQIESRIDQDAEISPQLTLWNQEGSQVIRGNLLVIPIENSLLYFEPLYLQSRQSPFPELKRVVVADSRSVVMRETLSEALSALVSGSTGGGGRHDLGGPTDTGVLARQAQIGWRRARRAAGEGRWVDYGRELERLEELLSRLGRAP